MTNVVLGYILAIVSSFFHTLYIIPRKISKQNPIIYILYMSIGFMVSSIIIGGVHIIKGYTIDFTNPILIYAAIAGVLSMIASICVVLAIDEIGMSKSNQWKNFQGPIGAGLIFMFLSALFYIFIKRDRNIETATKKDNILAVLAGIIYYFATYFFITAYKYLQGSIVYTIVQLNTVFTVLFGILLFKELDLKKDWKRIIFGIIFSIIGLLMLMIAQK